MSKAILISIQPKWCELIASGKKTVEVRKTKPKIETPFKCYIYQSRKTWAYNIYSRIADWQGKVIGEFVCSEIYSDAKFNLKTQILLEAACLSLMEIASYLKPNQTVHFWHISDLVIYDKPKELSEFSKPISGIPCLLDCGMFECVKCHNKAEQIKRPPQSWCYVEAKCFLDEICNDERLKAQCDKLYKSVIKPSLRKEVKECL